MLIFLFFLPGFLKITFGILDEFWFCLFCFLVGVVLFSYNWRHCLFCFLVGVVLFSYNWCHCLFCFLGGVVLYSYNWCQCLFCMHNFCWAGNGYFSTQTAFTDTFFSKKKK